MIDISDTSFPEQPPRTLHIMLRCESQTCHLPGIAARAISPVLDNVNWHNENSLLASLLIAELIAADDLILGGHIALRQSTKKGICEVTLNPVISAGSRSNGGLPGGFEE